MPKSVFSDAHNTVVRLLVRTRIAAGLRQAELAARIGKGQSFISRIEQGQRRVDVLEFYALIRAMGLEPADAYADLARQLPHDVEV